MVLRKIKLLMAGLLIMASASMAAVLSTPSYAGAQQQAACEAIGKTWNGSSCGDGEAKINNTVENLVRILSVVVGIIAVIMIIVGGFHYITSGGDSNKVSTAKNTIIYAIIGLVIAVLAQVIVGFVIDQAV